MSVAETSALPIVPIGDLVLIGHPNVGKSMLFQRLTGRYVTVANYPGTTVEVARGTARTDGLPVVDTPGIVALPPHGEDERVAFRMLLGDSVRSIVQVGDGKNVRRTLLMTVQLAELGQPLVLALNMMDEAEARGVRIDHDLLARRLGLPVVCTVATRGTGVDEIVPALDATPPPPHPVRYPAPVEDALTEIEPLLPVAPIASRGLALLWLEEDASAVFWLAERLDSRTLAALGALRDRTELRLGRPVGEVLQEARLATVDAIATEVVQQRPQAHTGLLRRLAPLTTHRVWGWPILAAVLYAVYWFVGIFGAGRLVGILEEDLFGEVVNPRVTAVVERVVPSELVQSFLVGEYGLWTMGMTYALALILPIVTTFFLAFSVLEDSGYLPRLAVVSNRLFGLLGLNGKAALPIVLGLGCVTMATLTTRILDSRRDRLLATLLLALGIPCSAQLGVVLGLLGAISLTATLIWGAVVAAVVVTVGAIAARLVPGDRSTLVLELPPLRTPRASNVAIKTLARLEWYMKEVVPLFLLGTALLFTLDRTGALPALIQAAEPLVVGWLGLPAAASTAFLIGFLRRDFGATGLFVMESNGALTAEQVVVAMVTITLFVPCVASVLVIVRERGVRTAAAMLALIFPLAFLVGGVLHRILLLVGWGA
jgi:ferrous iron transport protein B